MEKIKNICSEMKAELGTHEAKKSAKRKRKSPDSGGIRRLPMEV
jgi:hypothetical protein